MNNSDKVYQQLLQQSMNVIARQIQSLEQKNRGLRALTDKTTVEIEGLKLQYSELKKAYQEHQERIQVSERKEAKLDKLDEKSDHISEKQQEHIDKISELNSAERKGIEKVKKEEKMAIARNLLDILDNETIALKTGLTTLDVEKLRRK